VPGVPDVYQGTELWDLSLVDPDNRRPVDWEARTRALAEVERLRLEPPESLGSAVHGLLERAEDGHVKLHVLYRCLGLRRERPDLFALGAYRPLDTHGARKAHAVAFARTHGSASLVVVVGRLYAALTAGGRRPPLGDAWEDTLVELPRTPGELHNALTGERVRATRSSGKYVARLGEVFARLPVAVLRAGP
jgi:(1->4)-alpha-D-glucan 1-alpha-D-glucosylmutase